MCKKEERTSEPLIERVHQSADEQLLRAQIRKQSALVALINTVIPTQNVEETKVAFQGIRDIMKELMNLDPRQP